MKNTSDNDIAVYVATSEDMDQGGWVYQVDVLNDKGEAPPKTEYARGIGAGGSGGFIPLHPGKTLVHRVNVSKLYDLSRPGSYTIRFWRFDQESKTLIKSNSIKVTVTP